MILPTWNYQLDIGGGQFIFLRILMLCDILASQNQCSIKCSRFLQPAQKGFLNMVQTMPSPLKSKWKFGEKISICFPQDLAIFPQK